MASCVASCCGKRASHSTLFETPCSQPPPCHLLVHTHTARLLAQHLLCVYGTDVLCMRLVFVFVFV